MWLLSNENNKCCTVQDTITEIYLRKSGVLLEYLINDKNIGKILQLRLWISPITLKNFKSVDY